VLLAALLALWLRYRKQSRTVTAEHSIPVLAAWLVGVLVWGTLTSLIWIDKAPHGAWDAWAIWNSHARYIYRAGPMWREYFRETAHPDYPMLVSAAAARLWRYMGKEVPEAVGLQTLLIAIAGVTILAATLWELRSGSLSFLMPLLLLATPFYF